MRTVPKYHFMACDKVEAEDGEWVAARDYDTLRATIAGQGQKQGSISDDLKIAEEALSRATAKIGPMAGQGRRMPSGQVWVGSWGDYKKCVRALLIVRSLERYISALETPRKAEKG
jgi:hypothetical protein